MIGLGVAAVAGFVATAATAAIGAVFAGSGFANGAGAVSAVTPFPEGIFFVVLAIVFRLPGQFKRLIGSDALAASVPRQSAAHPK